MNHDDRREQQKATRRATRADRRRWSRLPYSRCKCGLCRLSLMGEPPSAIVHSKAIGYAHARCAAKMVREQREAQSAAIRKQYRELPWWRRAWLRVTGRRPA